VHVPPQGVCSCGLVFTAHGLCSGYGLSGADRTVQMVPVVHPMCARTSSQCIAAVSSPTVSGVCAFILSCACVSLAASLHQVRCAMQIDKHSKQLMQPRMRVLHEHNISAHDQLFQDSIRRQARQEEYQAWYPDEATFQPTLATRASAVRPRSMPCLQQRGVNSPVTSQFTVLEPGHSRNEAHQRLYAYHRKREVSPTTACS
jgi:hypothetical protein